MNVFAISDYHFYHANIIKYCNRSSKDIYEDLETMLNIHNSVISNEDICIVVGDYTLTRSKDELNSLTKKLNCKKILVKGNHDYYSDRDYIEAGFIKVFDKLEIGKYMFNHYPNPDYLDKILVCGHTHKEFNFNDLQKRINVAYDVVKKPVLINVNN